MMYVFFGGLVLVQCLIGAMLLRAAVVSSNKILRSDEPLAEPPFANAFVLMILVNVASFICAFVLRAIVSGPVVVIYLSIPISAGSLFFLILGLLETSPKRAAVVTVLQIAYGVLISSVLYGFYRMLT